VLLAMPLAFVGVFVYKEHKKHNPNLVKAVDGMYPVQRELLSDPQFVAWMAEKYYAVELTAAQQKKVPSHYAPVKHITYRPIAPNIKAEQAALPAVVPTPLPGVTTLTQALPWQPSVERLLLGLGAGSVPVTISLKDALHFALAGPTGKGKTNAARALLAQLVLISGVDVYVLDPHYADSDPENGDDWRPIRQRLAAAPLRKVKDIAPFIHQLATVELDRRIEARAAGEHWGNRLVVYLDELPGIIATVPGVGNDIMRLVREGRKYGIHLMLTSQDFLVKTVNVSSGGRTNLATAFYFGGDPATGRALLGSQTNVDEAPLSEKGVAYLRSAASVTPQLVRVPLVTNDSLYSLLGKSEANVSAISGFQTLPQAPVLEIVETAEIAETPETDRVILDMIAQGASKPDIIFKAFGVKPGRSYGKYSQRVDDLREQFLREQREQAI